MKSKSESSVNVYLKWVGKVAETGKEDGIEEMQKQTFFSLSYFFNNFAF